MASSPLISKFDAGFSLVSSQQALRIQPKEGEPGLYLCPMCKKPELRVYPVMGPWWHCHHCQKGGWTLDMFCAMHKLPLDRMTIPKFYASTGGMVPATTVAEGLYRELAAARQIRNQLREAWGKCHRLRQTNPSRLLEVQESIEIYAPVDPGSGPGALDDLMGAWDPSTHVHGLPDVPGWFSGGMVFPLELAPGLISGFLVCCKRKGYLSWKLASMTKTDVGGIGLGQLPAMAKDGILLLNDPMSLVCLGWHWDKDGHGPLPAVAAPVVGQYPDQAEGCSELIISSLGQYRTCSALPPDQTFYLCADLLPTAVVCSELSQGEIHDTCQNMGTVHMLREWLRSARPWAYVARRRLMKGSLSEAARWMYDVNVPQTSKMLTALIQGATPQERLRITHLFSSSDKARPFVYEGNPFMEKPGMGIFEISGSSEIQVSNVSLALVQGEADGDQIRWSGKLVGPGFQIPFSILERELRKNPMAVLQWLMTTAGSSERLELHSKWRTRFLDLCLAAYPVAHVVPDTPLGWDGHVLRLPRMTISQEKQEDLSPELQRASGPYRDLRSSVSEIPPNIREAWAAHPASIHLLICGLYPLYTAIHGQRAGTVVCVGQEAGEVDLQLQQLAEWLNLPGARPGDGRLGRDLADRVRGYKHAAWHVLRLAEPWDGAGLQDLLEGGLGSVLSPATPLQSLSAVAHGCPVLRLNGEIQALDSLNTYLPAMAQDLLSFEPGLALHQLMLRMCNSFSIRLPRGLPPAPTPIDNLLTALAGLGEMGQEKAVATVLSREPGKDQINLAVDKIAWLDKTHFRCPSVSSIAQCGYPVEGSSLVIPLPAWQEAVARAKSVYP